jgi:hypothetical protein
MEFGHNLFLVKMSKGKIQKTLWVKTWSKNIYYTILGKMYKGFKWDDLAKGCD